MGQSAARFRLASRVRLLRKRARLSQEELGFRANIHRTYIGAIERGEANITIDHVERLANALEVEVSLMFVREEDLDLIASRMNEVSPGATSS